MSVGSLCTLQEGEGHALIRGDDESESNSDLESISLGLIMKNAAIQAQERDSWFHSAYEHENKVLEKMDLNTFYGAIMIQPTSFCPADLIKTNSVRDLFDGGKWICGMSRLVGKAVKANASSGVEHEQQTCVVYSLGSQFDVSFERTIQGMTDFGCEIHTYDPTLGPPEKVEKFRNDMAKENVHVHLVAVKDTEGHSNITIGGNTYKAMGLKTMLEENGHTCIDVLKFDVEGAEYDILEYTDWEKLCIGMVLFEVHGGIIAHTRREGQGRERVNATYTYKVGDAVRHIRRLERAGFHHYKTEQVFVGGYAQAEMAFVNYTWLAVNPGLPKVPLISLSAEGGH